MMRHDKWNNLPWLWLIKYAEPLTGAASERWSIGIMAVLICADILLSTRVSVRQIANMSCYTAWASACFWGLCVCDGDVAEGFD